MTQLLSQTSLIPGGLSDLEAFDALARERAAREAAEQTAADLAELIARENARVADSNRQIADLKALLAVQADRAERLQRELTQAGFYRCETVVPPLSRWGAFKQFVRGPKSA